ncbi:MAG: hypothetical protein JNK04_25405 [Myxococcales bacterium]|nr:hypothetical protein [Myxococcales bacterium]
MARGSSTVRDVRDVRVDALFGELFVHGMSPQANVRVSVGYKHAGGFEPFAVGIELTTPRAAAAPEVGTSFRRLSDQSEPLAGRRPSPPTPGASASPEPARSHDALLTQFPSGVWVDPAARLVIQTGFEPAPGREGDTPQHRVITRASGASEILRRTVVWASQPS